MTSKYDVDSRLSSQSVDGSSSIAAPTSALSKAALYVSLKAYNQAAGTAGVDPVEYMRKQSSLPRSVNESSLLEFWQRVSELYHRSRTSIAKNTAGRPLNQQEIEEKLKQRALTLVGGGFNTQIGGGGGGNGTNAKIDGNWCKNASQRKRKRRSTNQGKCLLVPELSQEVINEQSQFLGELNDMWNEYANETLFGAKSSVVDIHHPRIVSNDIMKRISSLSSNFEWIGAKVKVEECQQHMSWTGRVGILTGESPRTWIVTSVSNELPIQKKNFSSIHKKEEEAQVLRNMIIPKQKSALAVMLPIESGNEGRRYLRILLKKDL